MTKLRWGMWIEERGKRVKWMNIDTDEMVQRLYPFIDVDDLDGMLVELSKMQRGAEFLEWYPSDEGTMDITIWTDSNAYATVTIDDEEAFKEFKRDLINSFEAWWDFINEILDEDEE